MKKILILTFVCIAACKSTGVVPLNSGSVMIAKQSSELGYGPPTATKADVYKEANAYCDQTGEDVETIDLQMSNAGFMKPGKVSLEFRCVAESSEE